MTIFTMLIASARTLDQTRVPLPPVPILLDAANALLLDGDCTNLHCYSDVHGRGTAPWTWRKHYVSILDATRSHRLFSLISVSGTGAFGGDTIGPCNVAQGCKLLSGKCAASSWLSCPQAVTSRSCATRSPMPSTGSTPVFAWEGQHWPGTRCGNSGVRVKWLSR